MVKFEVPGEPTAKARPRIGKGFAYTPKKTVNYENWVKECYLITNNKTMLEGILKAEIIAYMSIPKSKSKKLQEKMRSGEERPQKKPDLDNICKAILDSLNGIAYKDDSQIVEVVLKKYYSDNPRVEVMLCGL